MILPPHRNVKIGSKTGLKSVQVKQTWAKSYSYRGQEVIFYIKLYLETKLKAKSTSHINYKLLTFTSWSGWKIFCVGRTIPNDSLLWWPIKNLPFMSFLSFGMHPFPVLLPLIQTGGAAKQSRPVVSERWLKVHSVPDESQLIEIGDLYQSQWLSFLTSRDSVLGRLFG